MLHDIKTLDDASETKEELEQGANWLHAKKKQIEEIISEIRDGTFFGGTAEEWSTSSMYTLEHRMEGLADNIGYRAQELEEYIEKLDEKVQEFTEEEDSCYE